MKFTEWGETARPNAWLRGLAAAILASAASFNASGVAAESQPTRTVVRSDAIADYERGLPPAEIAKLDEILRQASPADRATLERLIPSFPKQLAPVPLYDGDIPNSKPAPDAEAHSELFGMEQIAKVSRPTYTAYLPAPSRASGAAVVIFPGGGYQMLSWSLEGFPMSYR